MAERHLLSISLSAPDAPLEVREPFACAPDGLAPIAARLRPHVDEALVLSTCNRFEVYALVQGSTDPEQVLLACLIGERDVDLEQIRAHARIGWDQAAAEHLLRVAAGLESVVLGETQVLGQLRRALDAGRACGLVGHRLGSLVQHALATGKRVQAETELGRGARSVSRVAVEQARRDLGDLTPEQDQTLQALTRALVDKLLHEPTIWLKTHPATAETTLRDVFAIGSPA